MIDIKLIEAQPEMFKEAARVKNIDADIDRLLDIYAKLKTVRQQLQDIATEKNQIGKSVPKLAAEEKKQAIARLSQLKQQQQQFDEQVKTLEPEYDTLMMQVPQPPGRDVPVGADDTENVEIRRHGQVPRFDFEPKDHIKLGKSLDIIDVERGVKLSGTRNYFLKGDGALLHWAILRFALEHMTAKGYVPLMVPLLVRDEAMRATAYYPGGEDQAYRMEKDELNLVGTAEVPMTSYHMGELLQKDQLPGRYVSMSSCFRREAGAAGKDTYGLYRIHQFDKVEQVILCKNDDQLSDKFHAEILKNSEEVLQALQLPYRVVNVCTGDLGRGQIKKFDIETWMPSRQNYCETHSASKFGDYQARRMNLRYKDPETKGNIFCHTLNNTVVASPRILIPILELYQNADGSVTVPEVLRAYMGKDKITK